MKTMMAEGQVHPDVISKLWQAYGKLAIRLLFKILIANPRNRSRDPTSSAARGDHHSGYVGSCETRDHDGKGRDSAQNRSWTLGQGRPDGKAVDLMLIHPIF